ncbi:MAG TPA: hypothetical protein VML55_25840 [Planctomycetaceae bacterium]|nr:hypothetical protein [Planctomycetaceae bacterium]
MRRATIVLLCSAAAAVAVHAAVPQIARPQSGQPSVAPAAADDGQPALVQAPAGSRIDMRKYIVETPLKELVANTSEPVPAAGDDNPTVPPGLVRWHDGFDQARTAAVASGRPVLLFQMIGRLDQRFT